MRCLGIPNTAHFANVTQIEDALACMFNYITKYSRVLLSQGINEMIIFGMYFSVGQNQESKDGGKMATGS